MGDRACVAIVEDSRVLMVRQTYNGEMLWTFPGGGIEPGESPQDAAIREAREEVNLQVKITRLLYQCPRSNTIGVYYCFAGEIVSGALQLGCDPELPSDEQDLHEVKWFPISQMKDHREVARILPYLMSH